MITRFEERSESSIMVLKGRKLRLYPNKSQIEQLKQMCGNDRFVWNILNGMLKDRYDNNKDLYNRDVSKEKRKHIMLSAYDMDYLLPRLKEEYSFLEQSDSSALQVVSASLSQAYKNHFLKPEHFGLPQFKKRNCYKLSYTGKAVVGITGRRYIRLPKLGYIKTSKTSRLKDVKIKRYTVERDSTMRWYVTFQIEEDVVPFVKTGKVVGLDLGLNDMVATSDGFKSGRFIEKSLENRINAQQCKYDKRRHCAELIIKQSLDSLQIDDFKNVEKARVTKAKLQKHLANKRNDFLQKLSTELVRNYDVIVIEDLSSKNLMKNHKLARAIGNASWYKFRTMLEYKCNWYGKALIVVPPQYTSQECSQCNHNDGSKPLNIREWTCSNCGMKHDRDINGAKNILKKGLAIA